MERGQVESRETRKRAVVGIQMRNDGSLYHLSGGDGEGWSYFEYNLQDEPIRFAERLDMECEKKSQSKDELQSLGLIL